MIYDEPTYQLIHDYLNGDLDASQRKEFEERMQADPPFAEEVKISRDMFSNLGKSGQGPSKSTNIPAFNNYRDFLVSSEGVTYANAIQEAQSKYEKKSLIPTKRTLLMVAASLSFIIISTVFYFFNQDQKGAIQEFYAWNDLPSLTERSDNAIAKASVEQLFVSKKYEEALAVLRSVQVDNGIDANLYIYTGLCQLELSQFDEALNTFMQLNQSDLLDSGKAKWYLALTYLKMNKKDNANKQLDEILVDENNFFYQEAKGLKELLE